MTALGYLTAWDSEDRDSQEFERCERMGRRRHREFPVRSQSSRTRGKMRARGGVAARHKAAAFNGATRRRLKYWA
jgi:hypothetical protein